MSKKLAKTALVSAKAPHPTMYSNKRSKFYLSGTPSSDPAPAPQKFFINLEDIANIETILQGFLSTADTSLSDSCARWWTITDGSSLTNLDSIFKNQETSQALREAVILESIGVALAEFLDSSTVSTTFLTLFQSIYDSFLLIIGLILRRLSSSYKENSWAIKLRDLSYGSSPNPTCSLLSLNEQVKAKILEIAEHKTSPGAVLCRSETLSNLLKLTKNMSSCTVLQARELLKHWLAEEAEPSPLNTTESVDIDSNLPDVEPPYLPGIEGKYVYTLVLDLDETLVHYVEDGNDSKFLVRPGCFAFLEEVSKYYEVVIFTAALQDYADWVLDQLDSKHTIIRHRLYRQHAVTNNNQFLKDLSRIGRDLSKCIIVDNIAENFSSQPDNGILIRSWFDDPRDNALLELLPLLKEIVVKEAPDVRQALRSFRDQMMRQIAKGVRNPHLHLSL